MNETTIKDMAGWDDVEIYFYPGGVSCAEIRNGTAFDMKFKKPFKVGGLFTAFGVGKRVGGGVMTKDQALGLADSIYKGYGIEIPDR